MNFERKEMQPDLSPKNARCMSVLCRPASFPREPLEDRPDSASTMRFLALACSEMRDSVNLEAVQCLSHVLVPWHCHDVPGSMTYLWETRAQRSVGSILDC